MRNVDKALAYITRGNKLLVFRHLDYPDSGIQVPGGTIQPGERPEEAVLREAQEESGLDWFSEPELLGTADFDQGVFGKDELHHRHFFHLCYDGPEVANWRHDETDPSDGTPGPIRLEFYWVDLQREVPELVADQGAFLHVLNRKMG